MLVVVLTAWMLRLVMYRLEGLEISVNFFLLFVLGMLMTILIEKGFCFRYHILAKDIRPLIELKDKWRDMIDSTHS